MKMHRQTNSACVGSLDEYFCLTEMKTLSLRIYALGHGFVSIIREKVLNLKGAFQRTFNRPLSRLLLLQFHAKPIAIVRLTG